VAPWDGYLKYYNLGEKVQSLFFLSLLFSYLAGVVGGVVVRCSCLPDVLCCAGVVDVVACWFVLLCVCIAEGQMLRCLRAAAAVAVAQGWMLWYATVLMLCSHRPAAALMLTSTPRLLSPPVQCCRSTRT
jgi:hypothetical protein